MSTILLLTDQVPWLMAPATLIAVTSVITLVSVAIRHTGWPFKSMVLATMLALTVGVTLFAGINWFLLIHRDRYIKLISKLSCKIWKMTCRDPGDAIHGSGNRNIELCGAMICAPCGLPLWGAPGIAGLRPAGVIPIARINHSCLDSCCKRSLQETHLVKSQGQT